MKLAPHFVHELSQANGRFEELTQIFRAFVGDLAHFKNIGYMVSGIEAKEIGDPLCFTVSYRSVLVSFRLICGLSLSNKASAHVLCTLEKPAYITEDRLLGSFSFNFQGITDIEVSSGTGHAEIRYAAQDIVLHFLHLALAKGVTTLAVEPLP